MEAFVTRLCYFLMIINYFVFIYKAIYYFDKSNINDKIGFKFLQLIGFVLIVLLLVCGFSTSISIIEGSICLILLVLSLILILDATKRNETKFRFAFSHSEPDRVITQGAYKLIRHPIYASYCIAWLAGTLFTKSLIALGLALTMIILYLRAINLEEQEFLNSDVSDEYSAYMKTTYRLFPLIY